MTRQIKFFTRETLWEANRVAIATNRNRQLVPEAIDNLNAELRMPVVFSMVHNDVELRVAIAVNDRGDQAWLDIPFETYEALPYVEVADDDPAQAEAV